MSFSSSRSILCLTVLWFAGGISLWAEEAAPAWSMSAADRQAVVAVVDRAIVAGMPDARGGKLYQGALKLVTADDQKAAGERKISNVGNQTFNGLHLKLADGTWVVSLTWSLAGAQGITVDDKGLSELAVDQVLIKAQQTAKERGWDGMRRNVDEQLKHFAPDQHSMFNALMDLSSIQMFIQSQGELAVPTAHLIRLGMPRAEELALFSASMLMWNDEAVAICDGKPSRLRLLSANQEVEWQARAARFETATDLRLPEPAASLRRMLAMHFYNHVGGNVRKPFPTVAPAAAVKVMEAVLADDPGLPALRTELARLVERAGLPLVAAEGADLAARLAVWGRNEGQDPAMMMQFDDDSMAQYAEMSDAELAQMPENIREGVKRLRKGPEYGEQDIGGLVALANDRRPSRWLDLGRFRTLGDNALRALATVLGCDPRALVKRDITAPWTDAERDATAAALSGWWKDNQGKPLSAIIASVIDQMSLPDLARQLKRADEPQRAQLLDLLAKTWTTQAPKKPDPQALAQILVIGKDHAALTKAVVAWPPDDSTTVLLAAWQLTKGDGKPFDKLFAAELEVKPAAKPDAKPDAKPTAATARLSAMGQRQRLPSLLAIAYRHPDAARLHRLLTALAGPLDAPAGQGLMNAVSQAMWGGMNGEINTLWGKGGAMAFNSGRNKKVEDEGPLKAAAALPLAVFGTLLKDQRPAPKALADQHAQQAAAMAGNRRQKPGDKADEKPKPIATDLRVSDIAAVMFAQQGWNLQLDKLIGNEAQQRLMKQRIDLTTGQEERDRVINEQRRLIAEALPPALKAAGLPEMLPGLTEVQQAGDDKAAF